MAVSIFFTDIDSRNVTTRHLWSKSAKQLQIRKNRILEQTTHNKYQNTENIELYKVVSSYFENFSLDS